MTSTLRYDITTACDSHRHAARDRLSKLAGHLCSAELPRQRIEALAEALSSLRSSEDKEAKALLPPIATLAEALSVHDVLVEQPIAKRGVKGWKLGWKGVFESRPALFAPLIAPRVLSSGANVSLSAERVFSAEAEFCVVLGSRLGPRATPYTETEVWRAVDRLELAIELCGARQFRSKDRLHYVADALLGAGVVRGPSVGKPDPAELSSITVRLLVGGVEVSSGTAASNPGDSPLGSLTFLANERCIRHGRSLEAGEIVLCGHCCQVAFDGRPCPPFVTGTIPGVAWKVGDILQADFEGLGHVSATLLS